MTRTSTLYSSIALVLLLVPAVDAQAQRPRRPAAPMLTNEDILSPGAARVPSDESVSPTPLSGSPLRNARAVLENALSKMSEVNSSRTRLQTFLPAGQREILIESVKPDRMHVISPQGEIIAIGRKIYVKSDGGWQVTSAPAGGAQSDAGFDFRAFVKQLTAKAGVRLTGQVLGIQMIDGIETVAYEFVVTDGSETGRIQLSVGKEDGYLRRMFVSGAAVDIKIWFTDINEQISIEPPI